MRAKLTILILSLIYLGYLLAILAASHYNSYRLNPLNSEYYFKAGLLNRAIEAEPAKAKYHAAYALELLKNMPNDQFSAKIQLRLAKAELLRAVRLAPYDTRYKKTLFPYIKWINKQL